MLVLDQLLAVRHELGGQLVQLLGDLGACDHRLQRGVHLERLIEFGLHLLQCALHVAVRLVAQLTERVLLGRQNDRLIEQEDRVGYRAGAIVLLHQVAVLEIVATADQKHLIVERDLAFGSDGILKVRYAE